MADQYISSVTCLIHCDGADNSTAFSDKSLGAKPVTVYGNAKVSTTQSKFGGSSAYFDGTGDYLSIDNYSGFDVGSGLFTAECWFYVTGNVTSSATHLLGKWYTSGTCAWHVGLCNLNAVYCEYSNTGSYVAGLACNSANSVFTINAWHHLALVRDSVGFKIYLDGTSVASKSDTTTTISNTTNAFTIGANQGGQGVTGYIDEIRLTKGIARYTTTFTPPTAAFDDPSFPRVYIKRGSRSQLDTAATNTQLSAGEQYLITDESRVAVGLTTSTYSALAKQTEVSKVTRFFIAGW